jgi:hypothetical protein
LFRPSPTAPLRPASRRPRAALRLRLRHASLRGALASQSDPPNRPRKTSTVTRSANRRQRPLSPQIKQLGEMQTSRVRGAGYLSGEIGAKPSLRFAQKRAGWVCCPAATTRPAQPRESPTAFLSPANIGAEPDRRADATSLTARIGNSFIDCWSTAENRAKRRQRARAARLGSAWEYADASGPRAGLDHTMAAARMRPRVRRAAVDSEITAGALSARAAVRARPAPRTQQRPPLSHGEAFGAPPSLYGRAITERQRREPRARARALPPGGFDLAERGSGDREEKFRARAFARMSRSTSIKKPRWTHANLAQWGVQIFVGREPSWSGG